MRVSDDPDQVLKGKPRRKARDLQRPSRMPWVAGMALSALALVVTLQIGAFNRGQFFAPSPEVIAAAPVEQEPAVETTGAITKTPADPSRPNELSRTTTAGGAQIITVAPQIDPADIVIRDPSEIGQNLRIAHLPVPDLLEVSGNRRLPAIGGSGQRPFDAYARPWSGTAGPRVALLIGGLGVSQTSTQAAIKDLPEAVTLGFASTGNSLDRWMQAARRDGHEIIMQVPMEPLDYPSRNPGLNTLTVDASADENIDRLHWALGRTTNYVGIMNYMGGRFTADAAAMEPVIKDIAARGLMWLDDGTSAQSTAAPLAAATATPFAQADLVIDAARTKSAILARLGELEQIARSQGVAIGTGTAFPETVEAVAEWAKAARARGIELVPITAVAQDRR